MARWSRAARALQLPAGSAVLDLGCAFGFGTRFLARRYRVAGHDLDPKYIARARASLTSVPFTVGPADQVPYEDASFDGVVLLDVLEHVPQEAAVLREIARVIRPGGRLVISVPNRGLLGWFDSLNLYHRLFGANAPPPTDDPSWSRSPQHRHYSETELRRLLAPHFSVVSASYSGLGIAEFVHFALLVAFRRFWNRPKIFQALQYLYFAAYLLEDVLPAGDWGYHLFLTAERDSSDSTAV